ncbi:MAG: hypothetical protein ACREIF_13470 [Chthoniobacterales bacterium]
MFYITECDPAGFPPNALNSSTGIGPASSRRTPGLGAAERYLERIVAVVLFALPLVAASGSVSLSHREALRIGRRIWQNECGETVAGLTSWNEGEGFASLGIGHFIWYPAGRRGPFAESFPEFVRYAEKRGARLPELLQGGEGEACPWNSRADFLQAGVSVRMKDLRRFLIDTIDLQADFLVARLRGALPRMLAVATPGARGRIARQFDRVASSGQGCYALIDYVNFKGDGVLVAERYRGRGWGLLQVLDGMADESEGAAATSEFADSAARLLRERVKNSPPERNERRWLPGWLNRVASYR